jgi:hypothetical protein
MPHRQRPPWRRGLWLPARQRPRARHPGPPHIKSLKTGETNHNFDDFSELPAEVRRNGIPSSSGTISRSAQLGTGASGLCGGESGVGEAEPALRRCEAAHKAPLKQRVPCDAQIKGGTRPGRARSPAARRFTVAAGMSHTADDERRPQTATCFSRPCRLPTLALGISMAVPPSKCAVYKGVGFVKRHLNIREPGAESRAP